MKLDGEPHLTESPIKGDIILSSPMADKFSLGSQSESPGHAQGTKEDEKELSPKDK